jgi:hypothetical protein
MSFWKTMPSITMITATAITALRRCSHETDIPDYQKNDMRGDPQP